MKKVPRAAEAKSDADEVAVEAALEAVRIDGGGDESTAAVRGGFSTPCDVGGSRRRWSM
jgi:hypothetical protein